MFWVNFKRILKTGAVNFWRSGVVSFSAVLVMTVTLLILAGALFTSAIVSHSLNSLKNSVNVNINILDRASEEEILSLKSKLEGLPEVESIEYVSRDQALTNYRERHKDEPELLAPIEELDENPLRASLNIKAREIDQYAGVQKYLDENMRQDGENNIIEEVKYLEKQAVIEKLSGITKAVDRFGFVTSIVFIILSILITLNTIRLTMFISKEEIQVMNLVGAEHGYISGPFVVTGAMYGAISAILVLILLYPITYFASADISKAFFDLNIFSYYVVNFGQFFLVLLFAGIFIGAISSMIAINRYLKV